MILFGCVQFASRRARLRRSARLRCPVSCLLEFGLALGAAGGLMAVEQREYLEVFGATRCLLRANHVVEVGDHDHDVSDADLSRYVFTLGEPPGGMGRRADWRAAVRGGRGG